jgi:hypothetical protein
MFFHGSGRIEVSMQKTCAIKVLGQPDFETHGLAQGMRGLRQPVKRAMARLVRDIDGQA